MTAEITAHKLLTRKWREENIHKHYGRLNEAKPIVETRNTGNYFPHLITKPKTRQIEEGKLIFFVTNSSE